jgi:hypothetical protein
VTRIALVANREAPDLGGDGPWLAASFEAVGVDIEVLPWGSGPDWAAFDGVVIRTTWDYVFDRPAFLDWAGEVASRTRLANSLEVLAWNTDKRYLRDLEAAGVPIVPTVWVEAGEPVPRPEWPEFVVKPSVSAGARLSARYQRGQDVEAHVHRIHATGAAAMLQPYLPSVDAAGETGTYVFGGEVSHAIRKGQALPPAEAPVDDMSWALVQPVEPAEVDPQLTAFAHRVMEPAPPLLYARVDTAAGPDGQPLLLELEAAEPFLFLEHAPAAADHFAAAVVRWLES